MRSGLVLLLPSLLWPLCAAGQPPGRDLPIEEAVRVALENRAELEAATFSVEAREAAARQASRAPNPTLSFQTENWRFADEFSASRDVDFFVYASQRLETGGKRRLRTAAADSDRGVAQAEQAVLGWRVTNAVRGAWWRASAAAERARLLESSLESAAEMVRYHEVRVREGAAAEVDLLRVRVEQERRKSEAATAMAQAEQAKLALLREMAVAEPFAVELTVRPRVVATRPSNEWIPEALAARPDLSLQRALINRAQAAVEVQQARAKPDVTPYFGYKRTGALDTLIGGVSIPLPVRDRNLGGIDEALAEVKRQEALARAAEARVRAEVEAAAAELARRGEIVRSLETGVVEQAVETHRIAQAAYREEAVELLFVLDALRTRNEVELLYSQALFDYELSRERLLAVTATAVEGGLR